MTTFGKKYAATFANLRTLHNVKDEPISIPKKDISDDVVAFADIIIPALNRSILNYLQEESKHKFINKFDINFQICSNGVVLLMFDKDMNLFDGKQCIYTFKNASDGEGNEIWDEIKQYLSYDESISTEEDEFEGAHYHRVIVTL